jgi:cell wall-associated NlpC family hydrolase
MLTASFTYSMSTTRAQHIFRILGHDDSQSDWIKQRLYRVVRPYVGNVPYRFGGTSLKSGIDCSAFTRFVFKRFGINLPRTAMQQAKMGMYVKHRMLRPADLVFFDASPRRSGLDHVGIYLGSNRFVHSVSGRGVVIQRLEDFGHPVVCGKRVLS